MRPNKKQKPITLNLMTLFFSVYPKGFIVTCTCLKRQLVIVPKMTS